MTDFAWMLPLIRSIHEEIRSPVVSACEHAAEGEMSQVVGDGHGDTIYSIDRLSETLLVDLFERKIASQIPIVLIAEGLQGGTVTLPRSASEKDALCRVIADPIDGTRCLMYQKRSGWILTGVAPNHGEFTRLKDIELAVQTEIPLVKQHLCDSIWALRGKGAHAERFNRISGERHILFTRPSTAEELAHGFSSIARFCPGGRDVLASIDDEIFFAAAGPSPEGKAYCFEDQYLSTGGQLYELMMGHDRFLADLRPLLRGILQQRGWTPSLCCHPYDLCTELIAREAGVIVTNEAELPLDSPLNIEVNVSWIGYANSAIRALVEPLLQSAVERRILMPSQKATVRPTSPLSKTMRQGPKLL
jgi:fructose-1,6-bisphosphatase/inositol monophosphatase family enzyme